MWSTRATLLLFLLACICSITRGWELSGLTSFTVPVLMWSDKQIFSKSQVTDTVSTTDVEYVLESLLLKNTNKDSKLSTSFTDNAAATELVILFVEPELRTDQVPYIASAYSSSPVGGSFSHLKKAMETAQSSLSIPYTTVSSVSLFDPSLEQLIEAVDGSIFMSSVSGSDLFSSLKQHDDVKSVAFDSLMSTLKSSNVFSNEKTDLVIVAFDKANKDDIDEHDAMIGSLMERISAKGNYVAIYAANKPVANKFIWTFEEHSKAEFQQNVNLYMFEADPANCTDPNCTNPNPNKTTHHRIPNLFPGPFIEALFVSIILVTMLFTGACAIFGLQTPDKWDIPKSKRDIL
jgi:hypothetical protein